MGGSAAVPGSSALLGSPVLLVWSSERKVGSQIAVRVLEVEREREVLGWRRAVRELDWEEDREREREGERRSRRSLKTCASGGGESVSRPEPEVWVSPGSVVDMFGTAFYGWLCLLSTITSV